MKRMTKISWPVYALMLVSIVALAIGGCANQPSVLQGTNYTVGIGSKDSVGDYLIEQNGKALYYFAKDTINTSNATGVVLDVWPVFYAENLILPADLDPANFGTINRADGKKQTTYRGWPLYSYKPDVSSGDTLGEGFGGVWFVVKVPFYTVMVESKPDVGIYLVDPNGMALYHAAFDISGKSNATSAILGLWPIFSQSNFIVPSTLNPPDFSITTTNGQVQATYKGWPLYYFINDKAPGDISGQGVKEVWAVTAPDIASAPSTPAKPVP